MDIIGSQTIEAYFGDQAGPDQVSNAAIRKAAGHRVGSYFQLAKKVAELQFLNREYVLLFRGQHEDYRDTTSGFTLIKPSLFRPIRQGRPSSQVLKRRFANLRAAELELANRFEQENFAGSERLFRQRVLRWAILQHYEICRTPLLDVSQSLRIAASFATVDNPSDEAFLYVFGVPNISGAVTASSEAGLQIVRLASACPPEAIRPHLQEGYLLGEYPEMTDFGQQLHYSYAEMDFSRRLVAKFRFDPVQLWKSSNFLAAPREALFPTERRDPLLPLANELRSKFNTEEA